MTLPARMQPPSEFNEEETTVNLNCQTQISMSPPILNSNGTGSIGRVENSKKGFYYYNTINRNIYFIIYKVNDLKCCLLQQYIRVQH